MLAGVGDVDAVPKLGASIVVVTSCSTKSPAALERDTRGASKPERCANP
jgi:hypothetical protein